MNFFDIAGIASRIPFELVQKFEADIPKFQRLMALEKQAEPHVTALEPIIKEAETIWASVSPDVQQLMGALK
jgi:hypothetical protein